MQMPTHELNLNDRSVNLSHSDMVKKHTEEIQSQNLLAMICIGSTPYLFLANRKGSIVYRVLAFLHSLWFGSPWGRGSHTPLRGREWGDPNHTPGQKRWYSIYYTPFTLGEVYSCHEERDEREVAIVAVLGDRGGGGAIPTTSKSLVFSLACSMVLMQHICSSVCIG